MVDKNIVRYVDTSKSMKDKFKIFTLSIPDLGIKYCNFTFMKKSQLHIYWENTFFFLEVFNQFFERLITLQSLYITYYPQP